MIRGSLSGSCPGKFLSTMAFEVGLGCQTFLASAKSQGRASSGVKEFMEEKSGRAAEQ